MVAWKQEQAVGAALTLNDAIALARSLAAGSNATTCPTEIVKTAAVVPASDEHSHGGPVSPPISSPALPVAGYSGRPNPDKPPGSRAIAGYWPVMARGSGRPCPV